MADMVGTDLESAFLVSLLRLIGRFDDVGDAGVSKGHHSVGRDVCGCQVHRRHAGEGEQAGLGAGVGRLA
ncbi:hypothetical protein D3C83_192960 [compost metagenome]